MNWSGAFRLPAMRQQLFDPTGPAHRQLHEHIVQVGIGVIPVHARRLHQANHRCPSLARAKAAGEQPAVSSNCDRPDLIRDPVVVHKQPCSVDADDCHSTCSKHCHALERTAATNTCKFTVTRVPRWQHSMRMSMQSTYEAAALAPRPQAHSHKLTSPRYFRKACWLE